MQESTGIEAMVNSGGTVVALVSMFLIAGGIFRFIVLGIGLFTGRPRATGGSSAEEVARALRWVAGGALLLAGVALVAEMERTGEMGPGNLGMFMAATALVACPHLIVDLVVRIGTRVTDGAKSAWEEATQR